MVGSKRNKEDNLTKNDDGFVTEYYQLLNINTFYIEIEKLVISIVGTR